MLILLLVILTRFSRVTFNAAHKYLGLTTELLRTEKLINDIAFHPLPSSFYEGLFDSVFLEKHPELNNCAGGGLQSLRSRFESHTTADNDAIESSETDTLSDYLRQTPTHPLPSLPSSFELRTPNQGEISLPNVRVISSTPLSSSPVREETVRPNENGEREPLISEFPRRMGTSPLRSSQSQELGRPRSGDSQTSKRSRSISPYTSLDRSVSDFDLRAEVMSCIAKSIGLIQPPGGDSDSPSEGSLDVNRSPKAGYYSSASSDAGGNGSPPRGVFTSSFGSLSMLEADMGLDDASSTSASASGPTTQPLLGLDNEVEIRSFDAGSTLVMAGERNAGMFFAYY